MHICNSLKYFFSALCKIPIISYLVAFALFCKIYRRHLFLSVPKVFFSRHQLLLAVGHHLPLVRLDIEQRGLTVSDTRIRIYQKKKKMAGKTLFYTWNYKI